jgi:hypothetical protein
MPLAVEKLDDTKVYATYEVKDTDTADSIVINIPRNGNIVQVAYNTLDLFSGSVEFSKEFDSTKFITDSNIESDNKFSDSIYFRDILLNHEKTGDMDLFALESVRFYKCAVESLLPRN